ncbi:MAG: EFR1 family ferrodoxin [Acetatifactor muris]|nr:EFR1 family ferrodoxin [Acetatifactor muris]
MVFYFTGTGNSLYVAKHLDSERISIPQAIHGENMSFQADSIGIVCPVYGHEAPAMVKEFVKKASFETDYFYMVLTYGNIHGGAAELAEAMLESFGKKADYINTVRMVDNFLPGFDMKEQIAIDPEKKVDEHIAMIKADIDAKKKWHQEVTQEDRDHHQSYLERTSKMPAGAFEHIYRVTDDCIGCGICTRVCPAGCIELENQRANHTMVNCQMCMACVHHCPQNAIRLNMPEKNPDARYHNENIRLTEIVEANNQGK